MTSEGDWFTRIMCGRAGEMLASLVKRAARRAGFDVTRRRPSFVDLMRRNEITTVLDVGANEGQFAREIRDLGYEGRIISFEPIAAVYEVLIARSSRDPAWEAHRMALADLNGERAIAVSEKTVFSSFKRLSDFSETHFPGARAARWEMVQVARLDTFLSRHPLNLGTTYLKIDTQGFEKEVLVGAGEALGRIRVVQTELALRPLYQDQKRWFEIIQWMEDRGFRTALAKENGIDYERSELLELDVVFINGEH